MKAGRLAAIVLIYVLTAIAWVILGGVTSVRSRDTYDRFAGEGSGDGRATVQQLWGSPQTQPAPEVWTNHVEKEKTLNDKGKQITVEVQKHDPVVLTRSRIQVNIESEPRQKGLLWYATYRVKFSGEYAFKNEQNGQKKFYIKFRLPSTQTAYDNVLFFVNDKRVYPTGNLAEGLTAPVILDAGQVGNARFSYGSQGMDSWNYQFGEGDSISSVRDFQANVLTDYHDVDFPESCLSPTHKTRTNDGWDLVWKYGDLISGSNVGISLPHKLNPGPFASRLSLFAPVSLLFFFAALVIMGAVGKVRLHPMHYLMLAASFFSFHLLFSYLVDHVQLFPAFLIAAAVAMLLTISYLRLVVNWKYAVFQAGVWQFVFLVLFAYAFFFEGYTGLTITIGAIVTLALLMQVTGRVNWEETLSGEPVSQTIAYPRTENKREDE